MFRFDRTTATGTCVLDDGTEVDIAPGALDGSGLRHLRPGQRITISVREDDGWVVADGVRIAGVTP